MLAMATRAFGWCVLFFIAYFAYVDQITAEETVAAVGCAVAIAAFVVRLERSIAEVPSPPPRGFANLVLRTPVALVVETWYLLGVVLWRTIVLRRPEPGRWVELRYEPEARDERYGRRAIVVLGSSISPNAIPLAVDAARGRLYLHQMYERQEPGSHDARYPF